MKTAEEIKEKYHSITERVCEGYQHEHIIAAMEEYAALKLAEARKYVGEHIIPYIKSDMGW